MFENNVSFPIADASERIRCRKVWGGIRNKDMEVSAGKILASIHSTACCGGRGGDIYYFGVCRNGMITRVAVADVTGHGRSVSDISQYIYASIKTFM